MQTECKGIALDPPYLDSIPAQIREAASAVKSAGGFLLLVGGCVRDILLGSTPKDWDCEVFGLEPMKLIVVLEEAAIGRVDLVGKSFGVIKLGSYIDIAIPRYENKTAEGHRGFEIILDPHMSLEAAAARRDLTINAIYLDPISGLLFDPVDGHADLIKRCANPTSEHFSEDPLRVLRAAQFISRFGLKPTPTLKKYSKALSDEFHSLSVERLHAEWDKLLGKGKDIAVALQFIDSVNWGKYFWKHRYFCLDNELDTYRDKLAKLDACTSHTLEIKHITGRVSDIKFLNAIRKEIKLCTNYSEPFEVQFRLSSRNVDNISLAKAIGAAGYNLLEAKALEIAHVDGIWRSYHVPKTTGKSLIDQKIRPGPQFKAILESEYKKQMELIFTTKPPTATFVGEPKHHKAKAIDPFGLLNDH